MGTCPSTLWNKKKTVRRNDRSSSKSTRSVRTCVRRFVLWGEVPLFFVVQDNDDDNGDDDEYRGLRTMTTMRVIHIDHFDDDDMCSCRRSVEILTRCGRVPLCEVTAVKLWLYAWRQIRPVFACLLDSYRHSTFYSNKQKGIVHSNQFSADSQTPLFPSRSKAQGTGAMRAGRPIEHASQAWPAPERGVTRRPHGKVQRSVLVLLDVLVLLVIFIVVVSAPGCVRAAFARVGIRLRRPTNHKPNNAANASLCVCVCVLVFVVHRSSTRPPSIGHPS